MASSNIVVTRTAYKVSQDVDFEAIYEKRFRKYLLLLAKEKELLKRMGGRRRRNRSTTIGNGVDINDINVAFEDCNFKDDIDKCFYNPKLAVQQQQQFQIKKASSVKDMRKLTNRTVVFYENTLRRKDSFKRLSIKPEENVDEEDEFSDSSSSSFESSSKTKYSVATRPKIKHAYSCDNIFSERLYSDTSSFRPPLTKAKSCEDLLSDDVIIENNEESTSYKNINSKPHTAMPLKNSLMTSSYRNLADKNIREHSMEEPKKLRTSSPYLERRLAAAKVKHSKRAAVLKKLDTDFYKAKEIIKKYKSTENLSVEATTEEMKPLSHGKITSPDTKTTNETSQNNRYTMI